MITEIAAGFVVLIFIWFILLVWKWKRRFKKLKEGYNEEEDKSRPSESFRREFRRDIRNGRTGIGSANIESGQAGYNSDIGRRSSNVERITQPERPSVLQSKAVDNVDRDVDNVDKPKRNPKKDWPEFE